MISEEERAFLAKILEAPNDPVRRLVYADWLEEQGDDQSLARAVFLRAECQKKFDRDLKVEYRYHVDDEWWRIVDESKVKVCIEFAYECPKSWHELTMTADDAVRFCGHCEQKVYYCSTLAELDDHKEKRHCVAIDTRKLLSDSDIWGSVRVGVFEEPSTPPENPSWWQRLTRAIRGRQ